MLTPFTRLEARVAVLNRAHVDTDQIIPKQFLTRTDRSGYGRCCFHEWRWLSDGAPNPEFPLNHPNARGAAILIAGENFGCGSSREHAVWALRDSGFRAILAPSFADIFVENCVNVGILPGVVSPEVHAELIRYRAGGAFVLAIDLERRQLMAHGLRLQFKIGERQRHRLMHGLDPIGITLQYSTAISEWEQSHT